MGEPLVLVVGPQAVYACIVLPDGRLMVLQTIPRPPDAPPGCLPYASWHLKPPQPAAPGARMTSFRTWCQAP